MAGPLKATFFALQKRERSGVMTRAAIGFLIGAVLLYVVFGAGLFFITGLNPFEIQSTAIQAETDPEAFQRLGSPSTIALLVVLYLVFVFVLCVLFAAFEAACLRWMLRGEVKGPMGLSVDADTWRVYGTYWAWLVFAVLGMIALFIVLAVLGGGLGLVLGQSGAAVLAVLPLIALLAPIYFCVRFAPAAATSVAEGRFKFFDAWKVSKGRFWALFGAFFLLWLFYLVVVVGLTFAWLAWMLGPRAAEIFSSSSSDPTAVSLALNQAVLDAMGTPAGMAIYFGVQVVTWVVAIIFYVLTFGINARAAQAALEEGKITAAA
jgi:hypothetical protein